MLELIDSQAFKKRKFLIKIQIIRIQTVSKESVTILSRKELITRKT